MKSESNMTEEDLRALVSQMHKVGSKPKLRRAQKRAMLSAILPKKPLFFQLAPTFAASVMAGVLIISGISFAARPGDTLYGVKRHLEDIRATVQPSYNETLLNKRNNEIEDLTKKGADDSAIEKANKEKQEIENRLNKSSDSDDSNDSNDSNDSDDDDTPSSRTQTQTQTQSSSTPSGGTTQRSARDKCKSDLDARKRAGENINSDQYKACDKL